MSRVACFDNALESVSREFEAVRAKPSLRQDERRWTTKQVIAVCLWSLLFGLGCGYGWLLLQIGTCQ